MSAKQTEQLQRIRAMGLLTRHQMGHLEAYMKEGTPLHHALRAAGVTQTVLSQIEHALNAQTPPGYGASPLPQPSHPPPRR